MVLNIDVESKDDESVYEFPLAAGFLLSPAPSWDVENCADPALSFIGCNLWLERTPVDKNYFGTTVILDSGLTVEEYKNLEKYIYNTGKPFSLDIIKFLTFDKITNKIIEYGNYGKDSLSGIDDRDLGGSLKYGWLSTHGYRVAMAYASIIRGGNIIFVDIDLSDDHGFEALHKQTLLWNWLDRNIARYQIKTISMSFVAGVPMSQVSSNVTSKIQSIYNKGVMLIAASGNDGQYRPDYFPANHPLIYRIGSVDHENRGGDRTVLLWGWYPYTYYDLDYKSVKGQYSGNSDFAKDHPTECKDKDSISVFCESYGPDSTEKDNSRKIDFVMPGNGVPIVNYFTNLERIFYYGFGTSFSTPYFAGLVMVANYAYNIGYRGAGGGNPPLLSTDTLYSLLKGVSSQYYFTQHMGYGWLNALSVYQELWNWGYLMGAGSLPGGGE